MWVHVQYVFGTAEKTKEKQKRLFFVIYFEKCKHSSTVAHWP